MTAVSKSISGGYTLIYDLADHEKLSYYNFCSSKSGDNIYAITTSQFCPHSKEKIGLQRIHRIIMEPKEGEVVDHINGNTLDNRRVNLRVCSQSQNLMNNKTIRGKSRYKGVSWHARAGKWMSQIKINGKTKYLGLYSDGKEAHEAYVEAANREFGEYANKGSVYRG